MSKNVLIIFKDGFPSGMASTSRVHNYCEILKSLGYKVTVLSPKVNGPADTLPYVDELVELKTGKQHKISQILYQGFLQRQALTQFLDSQSNHFTHVLFYGFKGYIQAHIIRKYRERIKFYTELNELPYSFKASSMDYIPFYNLLRRFFLVKTAYPLYNGIIVISESLKEFAQKHVSKQCSILKVPILVNPVEDSSVPVNSKVPYLFHAGFLNEQKDGIIDVFKAFTLAAKEIPDLEFWLTTRQAEKKTLKEIDNIIKKEGLTERVKFLGFLSKDEVWEKLKGAACVVVCKPDNIQNHHNFPTKIGEYLAAGVPLIYAGIGEARNYLSNGKNALITQDTPHAMAKAIVNLIKNPVLQKQLGAGGKKLAEESFFVECHKELFKSLFK